MEAYADNPAGGPLSSAEQGQIIEAGRAAKKIRKACGVAGFTGGSLVLFGVLSMMFSGGSHGAVALGAMLVFAGINEFRGKGLLRKLNCRGPSLLGWNQLGLMAVLIAYAAAKLQQVGSVDPYADMVAKHPELGMMGTLDSLTGLYQKALLALYGGMIAAALLYQGLQSLYYFRRGKMLREYLSQTPAWIVRLQRRTAS